MSGAVLGPALVFFPAAAVSLAASGVLVTRLERICARLGTSEAILGLIVALAADGPEITSAIAALLGGSHDVGVGVILGSNAFNLAALLGLSAIVAGRISLHRRVVLFEGTVALWMAAVSVALILGALSAWLALLLAVAVLVPYLLISAVHPGDRHQLPLPAGWRRWLTGAVNEEEQEIAEALRARPGRPVDIVTAVAALAVVIIASVAMVRSGTAAGEALRIPAAITGGLVLAAVTSLPNAVAAVYLARKGRASATLSGALNSNTLNVVAGLLIPSVIIGTGSVSAATVVTAAWYAGLTVLTIWIAYTASGLRRWSGAAILIAYAALIPVLLANSNRGLADAGGAEELLEVGYQLG